MLSKRIIPTILCRGRTMVKGVQFNAWRSVGLAAQAVRIHALRGVDEVCLLDIGATPEGRGPDLDLVRELSDTLYVPLAVGGGVRAVDDVKALLRAGADKVVIGTAAIETPALIVECRERVGRQAIIVAIDALGQDGRVMVRSGSIDGRGWARGIAENMAFLGAGEILLTSISREGTMEGYDLDLIRAVSRAVEIPVIAHGGCGCYADMHDAIAAGADAVAAGALFQFTASTPRGAAEYLAAKGVEVRLR